MNRFRTFFAASLLLCAANAGATCTASWAYFETRSSGPALVRCDGPNETLTLWQQPDEFGNQVWAHSPASSLDKLLRDSTPAMTTVAVASTARTSAE